MAIAILALLYPISAGIMIAKRKPAANLAYFMFPIESMPQSIQYYYCWPIEKIAQSFYLVGKSNFERTYPSPNPDA